MKLWQESPINDSQVSVKKLLFLILIAYLFSIGVRMIWVYQFHNNPEFIYNGQLMINTNDGYYWAEGARDILAGKHEPNDLSPVNLAAAQVTAFLAKVLPFSFESIILFMPVFLGALLVVPVILTGRLLGNTYAGFFAGLMAGITWSYYNRTMAGYYDTDMLTIVMPMFILWGMLFALQRQRNRYLLLPTAFVIFYSWWYPSSYTINVGIAATLLTYTLLFERRSAFNYKLLAFFFIALANMLIPVKILLSIGLFLLFHFAGKKMRHLEYIASGAGLLLMMATGGLAPIISVLIAYVSRGDSVEGTGTAALHYYNVMATVREAGHIPFDTLANRIAGHTVLFIAAAAGYALLLWRFRIMLLSLPLAGLGLFAIWGGLRFTVYAVPVFALGLAFLFWTVAQQWKEKVPPIVVAALFTAVALYPNIMHIIGYKVPTVFNADEVKVLKQFEDKASREDYAVAWWDYGYPIRYYSIVKTLIDGGKHAGDVNYPVSFCLTQPQPESAVMARMDVEFTERSFHESNSTDYIAMMLKAYGMDNVDDLVDKMVADPALLPKKTRNIYYYLPLRMMDILPTVALFSNMDLHSGQQYQRHFFYISSQISQTPGGIYLGHGVNLNKETAMLTVGGRNVPIRTFYKTGYDRNGKLHVDRQLINFNGGLDVIFMSSYGRFVVLDNAMLSSTYIQLFVFENYDPKYFEPVILSPFAKIYRLKI
jgi:undecaprenyl-diphosphooligosaccharide---protein glycotransferase